MKPTDFIVVGGGIVGLSTALSLLSKNSGFGVRVLEKEGDIALHQTGHNSGVIHSGIYYKPGSLKARFAVAGSRSMVSFCEAHGIPHEVCGKIIVATEDAELARLRGLFDRGRANGIDVTMLDRFQLADVEPNVRGLAAVRVPTAGIVDYRAVARALAQQFTALGGEITLGVRVESLHDSNDGLTVETSNGSYFARTLVNCGGLHSDRLAALAGLRPDFRIVPFRGEYYELKPHRRALVRDLIYPVPNPNFPFLGVHLTRMIDGTVHAGPNAVLSLHREGYRKTDFDLRDAVGAVTYPGFLRLARRHFGDGLREVHRSFSKAAFVRSLQKLVPDIGEDDVTPTHAGVRAQALRSDGSMVDDFLILHGRHSVHVCNAPSPAATASIEIGNYIADEVTQKHAASG